MSCTHRRQNVGIATAEDLPETQQSRGHTKISTDHGKLYLATVIDLYSRRVLGPRPDSTRTRSWL